MPTISARIRRVTADLQAIQKELSSASASQSQETHKVIDELLSDLSVVNEFKAAVDHMRLLLWSYIESASRPGKQNPNFLLQTVRMQRVTEMLRVLKPSVDEVTMPATPEAQSFFEVIQSIANSAMDHHQSAAEKPESRNAAPTSTK